MLKFLPGILLMQLVIAGLTMMALNWSNDYQLIIVVVMIALISAILSAFWFASIARNIFHEQQANLLSQHAKDREQMIKQAEQDKASVLKEQSQLQNFHARERERILVNTEREKTDLLQKSYQTIAKETNKAHAKANFKVGAVCATAIGAGGVLIFSQLVTVGVMFLVASGSGLSGYLIRARQERKSQIKQGVYINQGALSDQSEITALENYKLDDADKFL